MIFDRIRDWQERRKALRELDRDRRRERQVADVRFLEILEQAEAVAATDQRAAALKLCKTIVERFPALARESERLLGVLRALGDADIIEQLMLDGLTKNLKNPFFLTNYAQAALIRGDDKTALERWQAVIKCDPDFPGGYAYAAGCLSRLNRLDEAEAILARGLRRRPNDVYCLVEHAKIAELKGDDDAALERWQKLIDFPFDDQTYARHGVSSKAYCLLRLGRWDEIEAFMVPYITRHGVNEDALLVLAVAAEGRGDLDEAVKRYQSLVTKFPMFVNGYRHAIQLLETLGRRDEADNVRYRLAQRFPEDPVYLLDWARAAQGADNAETARRWREVRAQFPDCADIPDLDASHPSPNASAAPVDASPSAS